MSAGTLTQTDGIRSILGSCRRQLLHHAFLRGTAVVVITLVAAILVAFALDYLLALGPAVRTVLLATAVAATGWSVWKHLILPLRLVVPDEELGAAVDLSCPELRESLATLVSIEQPTATVSEAGSAVMRKRLQQQVWSRLQTVHEPDVVSSQATLRRAGLAIGLTALLVLPSIVWPSSTGLLAQRFLMPWKNWATATNLYFDVPDANRTVARGTDVTFAAVPMWRTTTDEPRPEIVVLTMTADNGRVEELPMTFDEVAGRFAVTIERIQEGFRYTVSGGGAESEEFLLRVVDAPQIRAAAMTATPPPYTGRAIESFDGVVGDMEVFDRSRLEIVMQFSKPVVDASLVWLRRDPIPETESQIEDRRFANVSEGQDQNPPPPVELAQTVPGTLNADGTAAVFEFQADVGGSFAFDITDEFGVHNNSEPNRTLLVIYDQPPTLEVLGIRDDDDFRPDDIVPVDCAVTDDIGVGSLELHYQKNDQVIRIDTPQNLARGAQAVQHAFRLILADLEVQSGDVVSLRVRASDERPVPRPHEVWSKTFSIRISDDAAAVGADALNEDVRRLVEALKEIQQQLQQDRDTAYELKNKVWQDWNEADRRQAAALSEKQQQQGRELAELADDAAAHPLMKKQAQSLQAIGENVREQIPEKLAAAVEAQKPQAAEQLQQSAQDLDNARRELGDVISEIEKIGMLEAELAELNRLALDAEQLAADAEQLDADRQRADEDLPPDTSREEFQQQLEQRQQQLDQDHQQLDAEVNDLLQRQQELLDSAQRAQQEKLQELALQARELARQQQQLANGVNQEARDAARDAQEIANQLQQARNDMQRLSDEMKNAESKVEAPPASPLDEAVRELRQGNLAEPQQAVQQTQQDLQDAAERLRDAALENPAIEDENAAGNAARDAAAGEGEAPAEPQRQQQEKRQQQQQREQNEQFADRSAELADRLQDINQQLQQLREQRNAAQPSLPADDPAPDTESQRMQNAARELVRRSQELAEAAEQVSDGLQQENSQQNPQAQNPAMNEATRVSKVAADQGKKGAEQAQAGQFARAAEDMRQAAQAAEQAAGQLSDPQQQDRQNQLQGLSRQFSQLADAAQMLQPSDSAQVAAQQQAQQQMAEQVSELPQQLADLSEKLSLPALGMQQQARQTQVAQDAAQQAAESSDNAAEQIQQGSFQQSAESGQQSAAQLNQVAQMAQQAAGNPQSQDALVPSEVGDSVAEALRSLQRSAPAEQQSSESAAADSSDAGTASDAESSQESASPNSSENDSPSDGQDGQPSPEEPASGQTEPGQGQPADGQPSDDRPQPGEPGDGTPMLNQAAQALAQAANGSLPRQFSPGRLSEGEPSGPPSKQATGNAAPWDGNSLQASRAGAGDRNWGGLNEALDTEVLSGSNEAIDGEYAALIRMYFRELARASAEER
ncbi:MAG: hypothetical protein R3C19_08345 [Planctomycetaceae bacterium]